MSRQSTKPRTHQRRSAARRRQEILETAIRLFAQQGFDGTSTKEIAEEAGISEGLIFHYFPTKANILSEALDTQHGFSNDLRELLAEADAQPTDEVLLRLLTLWLEKLWTERDIISVLFGTAQTNPTVGIELQKVIQDGVDMLSHYLKARICAGELRLDLPVETSALMFFASPMIFFVARRGVPESAWRKEADDFARDMLSVWMVGAKAQQEK